jgi:hypothetical protein
VVAKLRVLQPPLTINQMKFKEKGKVREKNKGEGRRDKGEK